MKNYRIRMEWRQGLKRHLYIPQERVLLFFWKDFTEGIYAVICDSVEEAERHIENKKEDKKMKQKCFNRYYD